MANSVQRYFQITALTCVLAATYHSHVNAETPTLSEERQQVSVTTRADVKLKVEPADNTSQYRLQSIGSAVSQRMSTIRTCYDDTVEADAKVGGAMTIQMEIPAKGKTGITEIKQDTTNYPKLGQCILKALKKVPFSPYTKRSAALLKLTFNNSAAKGAKIVEQQRGEIQQSGLKKTADGKLEATGASAEKEVRYAITSDQAPKEGLLVVRTALQEQIGGILDCRRRAANRGSSQGEIIASLVLKDAKVQKAAIDTTTIKVDRANQCATNILQRGRYKAHKGGYTYKVTFSFTETAPLTN